MRKGDQPLVLSIDPKDAVRWKKRIPPTHFSPGQVLFYRGHLPYGVLVIYSGLADLRLRVSDPKRSRSRVGPNTVLGLRNVLREEPYPLTAVVLEEIEASFVEKTVLSEWLENGGTPPLPL
ncbi:MAG: cyclic nucleotide-binding domain-containing protein [Pseudomonadota bacterium]